MRFWKRSWSILKKDKALSLLGLAARAGKIASGEFSVEKAVKSGKAYLVVIAEDASDNTKKMFRNMCEYRDVPLYYYSDKETLGHAIGKQFRVSLACLEPGFAKAVIEQITALKTE
jgi:ribosomal protein L7Ae-like RNA K-turn-binding protein